MAGAEFYRPDALPFIKPTVSAHWRLIYYVLSLNQLLWDTA